AIQDYAKNVAKAAIVYDAAAYPYFFEDANANGKVDEGEKAFTKFTPRLLKAAYNFQYSQKDPGIYAHNLDYATQILYDSLEDLKAGGAKVDMTGLVRPAVAAQK
nr:polyheme membrane-associated cytochrome C [Anaerolineae bacterium]